MAVFPDTSALAKLYHPEIGSDLVERVVQQSAGDCFVSRLGILEMHSVLGVKERTGAISPGESEAVRRKFRGDVRRRRFRIVALQSRHYEAAEALLRFHAAAHGLRTLDSLQLAAALDLNRSQLIDSIITADRVLCRVAQMEYLAVIDPEALPST